MKPIHLAVLTILAASCASAERAGPPPATNRTDRPNVEVAAARGPNAGDPDALPTRVVVAEPGAEARPAPIATTPETPRYAAASPAERNDSPAPPRANEAAPAKPSGPPAARVVVGSIPLVRGEGPTTQPAPASVAGHAVLPVWDDTLGARPAAVKLCWGESELALNLFDAPRATPQQIEFSLDGGPWVAARYGRVIVPDLGVGTYQVRCVAYPARGTTWVMEPVVLERTTTGWRTTESSTSSAR